MVASAVLLIMAAAVLPLGRITLKRQKEIELRSSLREMRRAIDAYKRMADSGLIQLDVGQEGYRGISTSWWRESTSSGQVDKKAKFLRRIPRDPFTGEEEWGSAPTRMNSTPRCGEARTCTTSSH